MNCFEQDQKRQIRDQKFLVSGHWYLFRQGIPPIWESKENEQGGRWSFSFLDRTMLFQCWMILCMGSVGESLLLDTVDNDNIHGVEIPYNKCYAKLWVKKPTEKLALNADWVQQSDAKDPKLQLYP